MYQEIPLNALVFNPINSNRISKMYAKKLRHNIEETCHYETLTVRPHPSQQNHFELLNGHARFTALRDLGETSAKCDIWNVDDRQSNLFMAILNKLRGSEVAELRMELLFDLMGKYSIEELSSHIPETKSYLMRLERLPEELEKAPVEKEKADVVVISFYLNHDEHRIVNDAIEDIIKKFQLPDSGKALVQLAKLYLSKEG